VSGPHDQFDELGELAAALCDGEITPSQAARVEELVGRSPEAKQVFLEYLRLHVELYWDQAIGDRWTGPKTVPLPAELRVRPVPLAAPRLRQLRWIVPAVTAAVVLAFAAWLIVPRIPIWLERGRSQVVARLVRTLAADWAKETASAKENADLRLGQRLELRSGLAEIVFRSGARLIVDGPAAIDLNDAESAFLHNGRLTAQVPPEAHGFTVGTPNATVTDLGTEFGVIVDLSGLSEVHAFAGTIQVRVQGATTGPETRELVAGHGVRVTPLVAGACQVQNVASEPQHFVRILPEPGAPSVATMSELVSRHPRLIHHYTFEGATPRERFRDHRGNLPLAEVAMSEGRGGGSLRAVRGFDATTIGVAPHRADASDNFRGVALQSEAAFEPPPQMTVELLLSCRPPEDDAKGGVFAALATRKGHRASFLMAALDRGQLMQFLEADAPLIETEGEFAFLPRHWYYVASSFRCVSRQTEVNTYAADLTKGQRTLSWLVKDQFIPGVPAVSPLGVGKGFDANNAHAYPWSGDLDEVAIYDAVLDRGTLEQHLQAIVGTRRGAARP